MLFALLSQARITDEYIEFHSYPFEPASVSEIRLLPWLVVEHVLPDATPPEVHTRYGDILFVHTSQRETLRAAAAEAGVPCVRRTDVWRLILEPFADVTFDHAHQEATFAALAASGVSRQECLELRQHVALALAVYNTGGLGEWARLGLYDLLNAYRLAGKDFRGVYHESVAIARRGALL
ncbi:MAG: hypothetical protein RLZZ387_378 [Chloroflexota bacterium]|jgi:hypothetical protein